MSRLRVYDDDTSQRPCCLPPLFKIGAVCGSASQRMPEALYNFGIQYWDCRSSSDDLLDVYGDTAKFSKNIPGGDICDNKKTYLYIKALQLADGSADEELLRRWFPAWRSLTKTEKLRKVMRPNRHNVKKGYGGQMERLYGEAGKGLDSSSLSDEQKSSLMQLAGRSSRDA